MPPRAWLPQVAVSVPGVPASLDTSLMARELRLAGREAESASAEGAWGAGLGAAPDAMREVARTGRAARVGYSVAAPIVVDDRLWGVVVAAALPEPLPEGTESRVPPR